jgi:hypothetical protein
MIPSCWTEKQKEPGIKWLKSDNVKNPDKPYIDKAGMFYTTDGRMCYASEIEQQKEQKPAEYLSKDKVYAIMNKLTELSTSELIPLNSDEYKKINEITSDVCSLLDYPIEQKPNIELIQKSWYMEGYHDKEFNCEPKWIIKTGEGGPRYEENPKYGQIIEQEPAEWSEEDEEMLNSCISSIEEAKENRYAYKETDGDTSYDHEIAWLKSLPERFNLPPKQEWSGEDEKMLQSIIKDFRAGKVSTIGQEQWLKSLRPSWKPSEEQMKALCSKLPIIRGRGDKVQDILQTLYDDLKKLM